MQQFPPPRPTIPQWRKVGTDYVKKYLDKEKNEQFLTRRQTLELPDSTVSLTTLKDVDDNNTAITEGPGVSELHNEETRQIYSTYFNETANDDPDLPITSYREQLVYCFNSIFFLLFQ
ncbi:uncharacterized protein [Parasteatoda tepidariorum]|uniref:uncharacterized protein n=1 Tax=Parasteatoda tepidariorum TaxID=114398 RepID=UPI0039BD6D70